MGFKGSIGVVTLKKGEYLVLANTKGAPNNIEVLTFGGEGTTWKEHLDEILKEAHETWEGDLKYLHVFNDEGVLVAKATNKLVWEKNDG